MRTIVHLSDLHFGRIDQRILAPLNHAVRAVSPDLVAISGDFTQRALRRQFADARASLDALPSPQLLFPGNPDSPFYNSAARFRSPPPWNRRYIADVLERGSLDER